MTFWRHVVRIISKYSKLDSEEVEYYLVKRDKYAELADLTYNIDNIWDMVGEIFKLVRELNYSKKNYYADIELNNVIVEMRNLHGSLLNLIKGFEECIHRTMNVYAKLTVELLPSIEKKKIAPSRFGMKYSDKIIGYALRTNKDIVCVEVFPTYISRKLWIDIFHSVLAYIIFSKELLSSRERSSMEHLLESTKTKNLILQKICFN